MAKIHIIPPASNRLAPLYDRYDENHEPGKAFMVLLPSGKVHFETTLDGTHSFDVHYGREWIWYIPPELTRPEIEAFGTKIKKLLSQVLRGLCISWDKEICEDRGVLTPKAKAASDEIRAECKHLFEQVEARDMGVSVCEPGDYFEGETPEDYCLDGESSNDEIRKEATELLKHLNGNNEMIYGDLFHVMKGWIESFKDE